MAVANGGPDDLDEDQSPDISSARLLKLLDTLHAVQMPMIGPGDLGDVGAVRWHLEVQVRDNQDDLTVIQQADNAMLVRVLEAAPGWRTVDGAWSMFDPTAPERKQTTLLYERHAAAAAPVLPTLKVSALVSLLRDPAYAMVALGVKLQQLAHLCAAEMAQLDASKVARSAAGLAYLSARSATHPGPIDGDGWTLACDDFPVGVHAPSAGEEGCAACEACGGADAGFVLRRAKVTSTRRGGGEKERQQVSFACDAAAVLRFMVGSAGSSSARRKVILDQLMPVVSAMATTEENARTSLNLNRARNTHARMAQSLSRDSIEADLDLLAERLEEYALSVLSFLDGDRVNPHQRRLHLYYSSRQTLL